MNLARHRTFLVAKLQRSHAAGMQSYIGINRIRIQSLPQHQHGFLVLIAAFVQKRNVSGQSHVARYFLPYELKRIRREPHILAAARDRVGSLRAIVVDRPCVQHGANIAVRLKHADGRRSSLRRSLSNDRTAGSADDTNHDHNRHETSKTAHKNPPSICPSPAAVAIRHCKPNLSVPIFRRF